MKLLFVLIVLSIYVPVFPTDNVPNTPDLLDGEWKVDLRASPEADPYLQTLHIKVRNNGSLSGSLYGSKFKKGVINQAWPFLYLAFRTKDRNNTYFHTARLEGDTLVGQTYCPDRQFIAPWTATRINNK